MNADTILPHEMPNALERAGDGIKVLSLDCFDTLLWRDCYAPSDVFPGLPQLNLGQRMSGEQAARKAETSLRQRTEISIEAIYSQAMPNANAKALAEAVSEEIACEARHCYAFAPTVELMREAKARGLKIIIVSDTYFSARQLRVLISEAAGDEVVGLIDKVFASAEGGLSKSQGLLQNVMKAMKLSPQEVLHIGDNKGADFTASRALGVPALHLLQFGETADQRLRYEKACHKLVGEPRNQVRALMPHRALLARDEPQIVDPAEKLGFTVLGPAFHAFDQWLRDEADALQAERGGKVHWLFMLRDGHLPHLVHEAGGATEHTADVEISRFVSIIASLTSREAYTNFFSTEFGRKPSTLARQMLFTEDEIDRIIGEDATEQQMVEGSYKLADELMTGKRQKTVRRRARERAERLIAHVRARANPQPGDTLMLVDLGYNGSAQTFVDALLTEAFDCHVAGRYMIFRELAETGLDKKGMIDERNYDFEMVAALCGNVAVIEQLATCELGSVRDFTPEGEPIREKATVKGAQSEVRDRVQAGVIRYVEAAQDAAAIRRTNAEKPRALREGAVGALSRFMFLPHAEEVAVLKDFEHDVNMGSERTVKLFDQAHAKEGIRRRGLFYMQGSERMFLPAELEPEDINTRLSLMVQKRFGLGLTYRDNSQPPIAIPAFFVSASDSAQSIIQAQPTHDGFYSARVPVPPGVENIALGVGAVFEWFELANISVTSVETLKGGFTLKDQLDEIGAKFDGLKMHAPGIHECTGSAAFLMVKPPRSFDESNPEIIEFVMRPLIRRSERAAQTTPAVPSHSPNATIEHKEQAA